MYVRGPRPWLRWLLPPGATGARVQVCATPSCDRVEGQWDVAGNRLRVPTALGVGVHFWRLFAYRGAAYDTTPGPTWEFVVPEERYAELQALRDINGDGLLDDAVGEGAGLRVSFGHEIDAPEPPSQLIPDVVSHVIDRDFPGKTVISSTIRVSPVSDINGDGFGDLAVIIRLVTRTAVASPYTSERMLVYLGGASGISDTPLMSRIVVPVTSIGAFSLGGIFRLLPLGDRDGDGNGDLELGYLCGDSGVMIDAIYGGAPPRWPGSSCWPLDVRRPISEPIIGDFDADGTIDFVNVPYIFGVFDRTSIVPGNRARVFTSTELDSCIDTTRRPSAAVVLDSNDDGYDDLRVDFGAGATYESTALYLGGPGGLTSTRCLAPVPRVP